MAQRYFRQTSVYAFENGVAAILFLALAGMEASAYLLHSYPAVEFFWRLTIWSNRLAGNFLVQADSFFTTPYLLPAVLAAAALLPLFAYLHRNWLGTAISGHVSLGILILLAFDAIGRDVVGRPTASLGDIIDASPNFQSGTIGLVALVAVMAALCLLNHFLFFARVSETKAATHPD